MKVQHIIGADLSKKTIDLAERFSGNQLQIENNDAGFKAFLSWLNHQSINLTEIMVVMEHTGIYSYCFEEFLHGHHIAFTKVNALAIKLSSGIIRGKTDKLDARRIAAYGFEKKERLNANTQVDKELKRLQMLYSARARLVKTRAALINAVKEYRYIGLKEKDILLRSQLQVIKSFDKQIEKLETETANILRQNEKLNQNYLLLQTITGVGKVIALATLIKTNNFAKFADSRKFACFCGTAPFEHSSGTSIKKRTRVSHLADKDMKSLLDLAAKAAIQHDKELKYYYERRLQMGKSKMSTINIVRNKILYRMFAVIKRQTPFIDNYLQAA